MWAVEVCCCPQSVIKQSLTEFVFHLSPQPIVQFIIPWSGVRIPPGLRLTFVSERTCGFATKPVFLWPFSELTGKII